MIRRSLLSLTLALALAACAEPINVESRGDGGPRTHADASPSGTDASSGDTGTTGMMDSGTTGMTDGGMTGQDAAMTGPACIVDPFMGCDDPDEAMRTNNEWSDAFQFNNNMTVGCLTGDNLTALDHTVQSILCPAENADWYQLNFVGCDTRTMFVELRMHPLTQCEPADWDFQLLSEGACGNGHVTCSMDGDDRLIRVMIEPRNVVFGWYFGALTTVANVKLEYTIHVKIQ